MQEDKINRIFVKKTCPVCGEAFYPAPMHSYKIGKAVENKLVCSYSCMRKYEKEHGQTGFYYATRDNPWVRRKYRKRKHKEEL